MSGEEENRLLEVAHVARKRRVKEYKEEVVERALRAELKLHQAECEVTRLNAVLAAEREAASKVTVWTLVKRWFR